jgi:hypothetical protein
VKLKHIPWLLAGIGFSAALANASTLSFVCDPTIDAATAGTCNFLNTTIAGLYTSTFSNVNASIYIQYGITNLGTSTTGFDNQIPYSAYVNDLRATASSGAIDVAALNSLGALEPALYGGAPIDITSALGVALGIPDSDLNGTTANGTQCVIGTAGCYNGIITISSPDNLLSESGGANSWYYRQLGGTVGATAYDFYSEVEHQTDEILGTASCVGTAGPALSSNCPNNAPAAVDLFRYSAPGSRVFISGTPGAYFSYDGGLTNGADGAVYNTLLNDNGYADFVSNCHFVQDATGCLGESLDITTDGSAEINILDAIGYNLNSPVIATTPEPSSGVFFIGVALLIGVAWRTARRKTNAI